MDAALFRGVNPWKKCHKASYLPWACYVAERDNEAKALSHLAPELLRENRSHLNLSMQYETLDRFLPDKG